MSYIRFQNRICAIRLSNGWIKPLPTVNVKYVDYALKLGYKLTASLGRKTMET